MTAPDPILALAQMFGNRLRKNARHRRKWARRTKVSCYRLYDRDIPELPLVVDWYDGMLHIADKRIDGTDQDWLDAMVVTALNVLDVAANVCHVKRRERQKGSKQYERVAEKKHRDTVEEGGLKLLVNLSDYLDTGLFLDHRPTRMRIGVEAAGKRFLNLFAYTGVFTVHAAAGGARSTDTVDLSTTYLEWAQANMALNGLAGSFHQFHRADTDAFLWDAQADGQQWDLVVVDPPTFSNSKRMHGTFDINRDHHRLLERVAAVTAPGGVIYFSTNASRFKLAVDGLPLDVQDITQDSVPPDFSARRPHRCWRMVKR